LGILDVQGGDQRFVVGWNWLPVFPEALDIPGYGVLGHFFRFGQCAPIGDTAGQRGHQGGESTLGFRPKDDIEMVVCFPHWTNLLYLD